MFGVMFNDSIAICHYKSITYI